MKVLKYKHLYGEPQKQKFEQVTPTTQTCDSQMVKANSKFTALIWQAGGGGVVAVLDNNNPCRLPIEQPMIKGHQGQIQDLDWYPFDDRYLATSGVDCTVKLWHIPEVFDHDITESITSLSGHDKKVNLIQWHPTASWVLASGSHDQTIKIWDVQAGKTQFTTQVGALPISLEFNSTGSLIGSTWNDKKVRIIDPRSQTVVNEAQAHQGTKPQRFAWLGTTGLFITVGFNKSMEREYSLWDIKHPEQPLSTKTLDQGSGVVYPFFDDQLGLLYLTGKGDSSIKFFELQDQQLHYLTSHTSTTSGKGYTFFPKRAVDTTRNEVMRAIKIEEKALEYISIIAPRKSTTFQEDLYPDCPSNIPAQTAQQYFDGQTAQPTLQSLRPDGQIQQQKQPDAVHFEQREPSPKKPQTEVQKQVQHVQEVNTLEQENQELRQRIQELEDKVALLTQELEKQHQQNLQQ